MEVDEARTVLETARQYVALERYDDAYAMLQPVAEAGILTGEEAGTVAFVLGQACRGSGAWDAAHQYLTEATTAGSSEIRAKAEALLAEIGRIDAAVDAEGSGVDQGEAAPVLAAGRDALARHDFDTALAHFEAAYQGTVDGRPKYEAALGIARAKAYQGQIDDAADYADYVKASSHADLATEAAELATWIAQQRAATAAAADGVAPDEIGASEQAAAAAYGAGDFGSAATMFELIAGSDRVPGVDRGRTAWNAALCRVMLDQDDQARPLLEFARSHGTPGVAAKADRIFDILGQGGMAMAAARVLDLETP